MTSQAAIQRLLLSPDGREKLELFGPHDGVYGFRLWQRKRKAWRRVYDVARFDSYARAVFEAAKHANWLARTLSPDSGEITYQLEFHRGLTFQAAAYPTEFGQHDHCLACGATMMWGDPANVETEGYVTRYFSPTGSGQFQSHWVCKRCFSTLRSVMQWTVKDS